VAERAVAKGVSLISIKPVFKPGPLDEKRAAAFLNLPENQRYPSRMA
jgi:hypothetical protein